MYVCVAVPAPSLLLGPMLTDIEEWKFLSVVNLVVGTSFYCGEFLQNVVNLLGVVNKIQTHQSDFIRNATVLT